MSNRGSGNRNMFQELVTVQQRQNVGCVEVNKMTLSLFPWERQSYDPSSSCWIYQVGLFLSLGSCLIVARVQNNRLVIVQLQLKQTDLLLSRQQIVHFQDVGASWPCRNGDDPSRVHFLYSLSPSLGSAFCKRQMSVCLRPIREVGSVWAHAK